MYDYKYNYNERNYYKVLLFSFSTYNKVHVEVSMPISLTMAFKMIPKYVLASTLVSGGGFLNGYDTGSIGGLTTMPQFKHSVGPMTPFILGFTVSLVMLAGGPPSVFAGQLADRYGRLKVIALGAVLFLAGAMLQGTAASLTQFLVGRMLSGVGEGVYLGNMSVYICEIAPLKQRGMLVGMPQFLATAGVCAGYFTCYKTVEIGSSMAWRLPYVVQGAGAALLALSCLLLPEPPRWLMLHGQRPEATRALQRLDFSLAEAERDFMASPEQSLSLSPWQSFLLLFKRGYRGRTVLALFVLGMVQLSGIDAVIYVSTEVHVSCPGQHVDAACLQYAPVLFAQAGLPSDTASFLASGLSAVLMLAISIPAFLFADKWGRRTSAITGGVGLAGCMLLMGTLYATGIVHMYAAAKWAVIVTVFVFGLIYCSTWNIFGKIYASEIQPSHTRAAANCVAMGLSFVSLCSYPRAVETGLMRPSVCQLARSHTHTDSSRQVRVWCLFLVWRADSRHSCGPCGVHAGNPGTFS